MKVTAYDLAEYQYATQPELAAKPSDNSYVFAAEDALKKI
jgi:NADH dehydrogenase